MDFDSILRESLSAVNSAYDAAYNDLNEVVAKIRDAMIATTGDGSALELKRVAADRSSTTFRLYIDPDPKDPEASLITVTSFRIPTAGYPILFGTYSKVSEAFKDAGKLDDKSALVQYFAEQLKEPESALVQAIGFAMRQRL